MKGFYLYCIREKSDSGFLSEGIDGGAIFAIPEQDLEAIVSEVSLDKFDSQEVQKRAKEDLKWITEKAQFHERIVQEAMKKGASALNVIPMKFGTIFRTKKKLEETLKKHYSKFKQSLENLAGKQEWGLKVYLNRKSFEQETKKVSQVFQDKEKEIAQLPEGMAYFKQKEIDDILSREAERVLENYTESFFEDLKKCAVVATKGKLLEKELTGKSLPMVLNAIFLVSEQNLKDFIKEINNLNKELKTKGFIFEYSGPWPPYNFV